MKLAGSTLVGPVNACSKGTITLKEVFDYVEKKTGKQPIFHHEAEAAPYNSGEAFSLNTQKAEGFGFHFTELDSWIYKLLDFYIMEAVRD